MYNITARSKKIAKENNLILKPSNDKKHKIDVFNNDKEFITSIGALGYSDYSNYIIDKGKKYADEKKKLYKIRHKNDNTIKGKLANLILWT